MCGVALEKRQDYSCPNFRQRNTDAGDADGMHIT